MGKIKINLHSEGKNIFIVTQFYYKYINFSLLILYNSKSL